MADGRFIGFMDNLTPCRISKDPVGLPWFRLDNQFMDVRRMRCFSGPPDCRGYAPVDLESADRAFVWYAFAKTFAALGYPMWGRCRCDLGTRGSQRLAVRLSALPLNRLC